MYHDAGTTKRFRPAGMPSELKIGGDMKLIESWIIKILIKAKIGEWIGKLFSKLTGWKTYIALILLITLKFALYAGFIPEGYIDIIQEIITALYGVLGVSFGDKIKRYWEAIKKTGDDIIER